MATKIILKKSTTGGSAPLAGDLEQAELAINLLDRKIYTKDNGGNIVTLDGAYVDSVAPGNPAEGDLWYDTANNALKAHNGSSFVNVGFLNTSELNNDAGFITGYTVTESDVTAHQAALTITESQISDLTAHFSGSYTDLTNVPTTFAPAAHTLGSHSDVTISSIASGEVLKWNGTAWENNTLAEAGIAAAGDIPTNNNQLTNGAGYITGYTVTQGDVTAHQAALSITESQISDLGSYLTSYTETDTLETVTGRGSSASSAISITNNTASSTTGNGALTVTGGVGIGGNINVGGSAVITGDLTVNGTTTTVNSNTVNIGDNIIVLNADETGAPSQDGGLTVERGTSTNVSFYWDESADVWSLDNQELANVTIDGGTY